MRSSYSIDELDDLKRDLNLLKDEVEKKTQTLLHRLAEEGASDARIYFGTALYAGDNDVKVEWEEEGDNAVAIIAKGESVLFIEFGTGIAYPDDHPEKPDGILGRGQYGMKQGGLVTKYGTPKGWLYDGSPGNLGEPSTKNPSLMHTYGNPANMSLYTTRESLKRRIVTVAREVFQW